MALGPINKNKNRYLASKPLKFKQKSNKPLLFPLHPDKVNRKTYRGSRGPSFHFNPRPFLFFAVVIFVVFALAYFLMSRQALAVMVNGEPVGYIRDMNTTEQELNDLILAKLRQDVGNEVEINEDITLQRVNSIFKSVANNAEGVIANVCNSVTYRQQATSILVEGNQAVIVANLDAAKEVLNNIINAYTPPAGTTDPEIATQIKTEAVFVESTEVSDIETATELLSQTRQEERVHAVVQGETFASIASNFGMTEAELLTANPSITNETKSNLSIGQQLKVIVTVPTLQMRTYKTETSTEVIDYETEREYDDTMYDGETEEIQEGEEGEMQVITKIPYINGIPQNSQAIREENVIKEPVNRILRIGTYEGDDDDE